MIHCIAFAGKIKEIFSAANHFFAEFPGKSYRNGHQRCQNREGIRPEIPDRLQKAGKGAEKQDQSACGAQNHEPPQFPIPTLKDQAEERGTHNQTIASVQQMNDPGPLSPEGPQQIVQNAGRQSQQDGLSKQQ